MSRFSSRLLACDDALSINEWLEFSQSGHEEFSAAICWVTPTDATTILESPRPDNRKISTTEVDRYSRQMAEDQWSFNFAAIMFSNIDGRQQLIDGQHRLAAIVQSQLTQKILCVFNCPLDLIYAIDQQKKRTIQDQLVFDNIRLNPSQISQIKTLWKFIHLGSEFSVIGAGDETRKKLRGLGALSLDVRKYYLEHKELDESSARVRRLRENYKIQSPLGLMAALHFYFKYYANYREEADKFVEQVYSGENISSSDLAYLLRSFFIREYAAKKRMSVDIDTLGNYVVFCWNKFIEGAVCGKSKGLSWLVDHHLKRISGKNKEERTGIDRFVKVILPSPYSQSKYDLYQERNNSLTFQSLYRNINSKGA